MSKTYTPENKAIVQFKPYYQSHVLKFPDQIRDKPVTSCLPIFLKGLAMPRPDPVDPFSIYLGMCKRVVPVPPGDYPLTAPRRALRREFRMFVHNWLKTHINPLRQDELMNFNEWLTQTPYPKSRKDQLNAVYDRLNKNHISMASKDPKITKVKSFIKDESYETWKFPRWINSRSDEWKCLFGPYVKSIEKKLYKLKYFIKNVPVRDRPQFLMDHVYKLGKMYAATDFTSFESHFTSDWKNNCERLLYKHMTSQLGGEFMEAYDRVLVNEKYTISNPIVGAKVRALRMSGEMDTSMANGFSNLMIIAFALYKNGMDYDRIIVEGDDSLFMINDKIDVSIFTRLGFRIKLEYHQFIHTASFCGNVFDPDDLVVVTDPRPALVDFGWTKKTDVNSSPKRRQVLLRAKAYSLLYQYGGSPILTNFALYVLRVTKRYDTALQKFAISDRSITEWDRNQLLEAIRYKGRYPEIGRNTRFLVKELYDIEIDEQYQLEQYFDMLSTEQPIDHYIIERWGRKYPEWEKFYQEYQNPGIRKRVDPKLASALAQTLPNNPF